MNNRILEVKDLIKYFPVKKGLIFEKQIAQVKAVDGVSFNIHKGKTFGLVGESGCGKTTIAKVLLLLEKETRGSIKLNGTEIGSLRGEYLKEYKRMVQAVFQDPFSSLNPRMRIGDIIAEPVEIHNRTLRRNEIKERVAQTLEVVGLNRDSAELYPHEFSGGQRQRIAIARALISSPHLIILDEPVSALDVSIRAQILNLLKDIQRRTNVSYLLIAHDLAIVKHMSDSIGVIYLGKIVEMAPKNEIFIQTLHPYSQALIGAIPRPDPDMKMKNVILEGEAPSPLSPPSGCHFHPRCFQAEKICKEEYPILREVTSGHFVACHFR